MNEAQLITLGNHIRANEAVNGDLGNLGAICDWYNGEASPDFWVFHESIGVDDAVENGIDWATDYGDNLAEKDLTAMLMLFSNGTFAVEASGGRNALNQVFSGASASKAGLLALATHKATELQKLFNVATDGPGGGDGSAQGQAAIAIVKGPLTTAEADLALEKTAP